MKYIKTYENNIEFKFDLGDEVVCINNKWTVETLKIGNFYIVIERKRFSGYNYYALSTTTGQPIYSNDKLSFFGEKVFVTPLEYETNKYNL